MTGILFALKLPGKYVNLGPIRVSRRFRALLVKGAQRDGKGICERGRTFNRGLLAITWRMPNQQACRLISNLVFILGELGEPSENLSRL
jgi:hypothetical protein